MHLMNTPCSVEGVVAPTNHVATIEMGTNVVGGVSRTPNALLDASHVYYEWEFWLHFINWEVENGYRASKEQNKEGTSRRRPSFISHQGSLYVKIKKPVQVHYCFSTMKDCHRPNDQDVNNSRTAAMLFTGLCIMYLFNLSL
ncbi:uncharacterized protein LOC119641841 [Glossina fuscipes]|uniref:Uncharacterized protein LOC119641841 n=1 Tax=Glossina fuscipes TaxID=7396 RepID=A0A9C6DYG6_9MUSC|nr:uncharacterized protein LOC119641841 [Glossina fuscipes]